MYLDRTSKKVLKLITTEESDWDDNLFTIDYVAEKCNLSEKAATACVYFLEEKKLIHVVKANSPVLPDGVIWGVSAEHRAYHYREFEIIEIAQDLIKSVLLPVVVALIVALIAA